MQVEHFSIRLSRSGQSGEWAIGKCFHPASSVTRFAQGLSLWRFHTTTSFSPRRRECDETQQAAQEELVCLVTLTPREVLLGRRNEHRAGRGRWLGRAACKRDQRTATKTSCMSLIIRNVLCLLVAHYLIDVFEWTQKAFIEEILDWHVPYRVCAAACHVSCYYSNRAMYGSDGREWFPFDAKPFVDSLQCGRQVMNYRLCKRASPQPNTFQAQMPCQFLLRAASLHTSNSETNFSSLLAEPRLVMRQGWSNGERQLIH